MSPSPFSNDPHAERECVRPRVCARQGEERENQSVSSSLLRVLHDNAPVLYEGTSYGWTRVCRGWKGELKAAPCAIALMCALLRAWPRLFQEVNVIHEGRLSRHLTLVFKCDCIAQSALLFVTHHRWGAEVAERTRLSPGPIIFSHISLIGTACWWWPSAGAWCLRWLLRPPEVRFLGCSWLNLESDWEQSLNSAVCCVSAHYCFAKWNKWQHFYRAVLILVLDIGLISIKNEFQILNGKWTAPVQRFSSTVLAPQSAF